ncbi:hypothetical protein V5799_006998 [Amblyomma americanum]|uniref:Uncharacterized protein n=1 Tax=Amblyomma americanum TaxID=6943 RepID=A0AAQ4DUT8_AMBAM
MADCWHSTPIRQSAQGSAEEPLDGICTTLSRKTTTDAATTTDETIQEDSLERLSSTVDESAAKLRLQQSRSRYRRHLTSRLVCAFCVLLFVAIAVCLACVAMLLHVEPTRGVLVAVEGSLEMVPKSSNYCVVGNPSVISAYKSGAVKDFENMLDSIYGNMSVASRFVGALVEDFRCLLRPGRDSVRVEVDFTLFWRRRRNRFGALSAYPGARDVADALHAGLPGRWLTGFRPDPDSITVGDSRTIA